MKDREFVLSVCKRRTDKVYKEEKTTWKALSKRLSKTHRTTETLSQYKKMSKDAQSDIKDIGGFVGGALEDGKRSSQTILFRSLICLDLDFVPIDAWDHFTLLFDWAALLYSTHKHTSRSPKYRIVIPLSRDVTPEEYEAIARKIADDYLSMDWADDTTFQPSRLMFWPSTSVDGEYVYECQEGELLDPDEILNLYEGQWTDIRLWPTSSRVQESLTPSRLQKIEDPLSKSGEIGAFCCTYTIQQAIETFLSDVYAPTGKDDRWTYVQGSTSGGLVIYANGTLAYSNHSTDPANTGHCLHAFDLVRIHKFGYLDLEQPHLRGNTRPSFQAMCEFVSNDEGVRDYREAEMFEVLVDKQDEDSTGISKEQYKKDNAAWMSQLERQTRTQKIAETIDNVVIILENDTKLKGLGRFNEFEGFVEKTQSLPWWKWDPCTKEWDDTDTTELILYMERIYNIKSERVIKHGRDILHKRRAFHPVRDYLNALPEWDGVKRVDTLLVDYMGAEDCSYTQAVTRKTLVAGIKRIFEPGCKMDYTLTLAGKQGIKKSSFFRTLPPNADWFSDSLDSFQGKEAYEALQGSWIIEIAELSAAKRSDIERTKQFLTKQDDKVRMAYAEKPGRYRRQCIFVATTNSTDFLRDMSGNRRWWIVPVRGGNKDVFKDLEQERDQIWAEAKYYYHQGETLYLSDEIEEIANDVQDQYTYRSARYDQIAEYLDELLPENWDKLTLEARKEWWEVRDLEGVLERNQVCPLEIWVELFSGSRENFPNMDQREIAEILTKLGWTRTKNPRACGPYGKQRVFLRPKD